MGLLLALIIVLIFILIAFLAYMARRLSIWGPKNKTYYQKNAYETFKNVKGDTWQDQNQEVIDQMASVPAEVKDAYDYFVIGATHMYGRKDANVVRDNYLMAIDEIKAGNVYEDDREFIMGRIRDHVMYHPDEFATQQLQDLYDPVAEMYHAMIGGEITPPKAVSAKPPPTTIAEKIEYQAPQIKSDSQNVHDAAVTLEFAKQYKKLRIYNDEEASGKPSRILNDETEEGKQSIQTALLNIDKGREEQLNKKAHAAFMKWMKKTITDQNEHEQLHRRFSNEFIMYDKVDSGAKILEKDVISAVWRRINSETNRKKRDVMLEFLEKCLQNTIESDRPVCVTGRSEQIMSVLLVGDKDPSIGQFVTTEILKAQLYFEGAAIVRKEIDSMPTIIKNAYNKGETSKLSKEEMDDLRKSLDVIHKKLDELAVKFQDKMVGDDVKVAMSYIKKEVDI